MNQVASANQITLAVVLSSASIAIALISLLWNIYKELLLRPRSMSSCGLSLVYADGKYSDRFIDLQLTNKGPGKLILTNIVCFEGGVLKKVIGKQQMATINYDWENAYNPRMPVEVGQYETTR